MTFEEALYIIEIPRSEFNITPATPYELAIKYLDEFKIKVRKQKIKLAKKYHPDKGGDEEKMKEINNIIDKMLELKIVRQQIHRPVVYYQYYDNSATTTTSSTYSYYTTA